MKRVTEYLEKVKKAKKTKPPFMRNALSKRYKILGGMTLQEYIANENSRDRDGGAKAVERLEQLYRINK